MIGILVMFKIPGTYGIPRIFGNTSTSKIPGMIEILELYEFLLSLEFSERLEFLVYLRFLK